MKAFYEKYAQKYVQKLVSSIKAFYEKYAKKHVQKLARFIDSFYEKHEHLMQAIGFTLIMIVLFNLIYEPYFESNDDTGMANIIYGYQSGSIETHLVYINIIIGYILKFLLSLMPNAPWYGILQYVLVCVSSSVLVYLLIKKFDTKWAMIIGTVVFLFFGYGTFITIQFTRTAAICTIAGILLLFHTIDTEPKRIIKYIVAFVLAIFGSLYRFNSFMMVSALLSVIGLFMLIERRKDKKQLLILCIPFIVLFGVCYGARVYNSESYKINGEWNAYRQLNHDRSEVMDYDIGTYEENAEYYNSIGLDETAFNMLKSVKFADPEVFTLSVFESLADNVSSKHASSLNPVDVLTAVFSVVWRFKYWFIPALILIGLVYILDYEHHKNTFRFFLVETAAFVAVEFYLYYRGRYSLGRIQFCLLIDYLMIVLLYGMNKNIITLKRNINIGLALFIGVSSFYNNYLGYTKMQRLQNSGDYATYVMNMEESCQHTRFMNIKRGDMLFTVFSKKDCGVDSNVLLAGGWRYYSPMYFDNLENNGYTNAYRDLIDDDCYLVTNQNIEYVNAYIKSYYNENVSAALLKKSKYYKYYRIVTKALDLYDFYIVDADDNPYFDYTISINQNRIRGNCYMNGKCTFENDIYIGIVNDKGIETFYYTKQYDKKDVGDYSKYRITLENGAKGQVYLYYRVGNIVYRINTHKSINVSDEIVSARMAEASN